MRIDSTIISGNTTTYYPYHTLRETYDPQGMTAPVVIDSNGGSWLGKRIIELQNGTFLFDNMFGDTIIIKTQAQPGDSWIFYNDTSSLYFRASLSSVDTMTILEVLDSVKTITINAFNNTGPVTSDPANNAQIILSKNHGFVQIIDLYCFPYHKPDTVYYQGMDFYLDLSLKSYSSYILQISAITFNIIDFINPTFAQMNNWSVGDVFESQHCLGCTGYYSSSFPMVYNLDSIVQKIIDSTGVTYITNGWEADPLPPFGTQYAKTITGGPVHFLNLVCFDTLMPEENFIQNVYYYYPYDSSYCLHAPEYNVLLNNDLSPSSPIFTWNYYKLEIGSVDNGYQDGNPSFGVNAITCNYYNDNSCGTCYEPPLGISNLQSLTNNLEVFPNPAYDMLSIKIPNYNNQKYYITLSNILGQGIRSFTTTKELETIDVKNLPAGLHDLKVLSENGECVNKKIIIGQ